MCFDQFGRGCASDHLGSSSLDSVRYYRSIEERHGRDTEVSQCDRSIAIYNSDCTTSKTTIGTSSTKSDTVSGSKEI
jgi:hypothetical protein